MAIQQPPAPAPLVSSPAPPPARKGGCAGCSMGCLGCLGVIVLVIILLVGGGYFFLVAQAQAGVASPAALLVVTTPVDVGRADAGYAPGISGQKLEPGNSVRTGGTGHASIQFPDGSLLRMSPNTAVTIQAAQLNNDGSLRSATLQQKVGRTLATVQKLVGGATFTVGGHSVSAEVRGTEFEVLVRPDGSNQIKVFDGSVKVSGQTSVTLTAGQQIEVDPNGRLGPAAAIQPDRADPFALIRQCNSAVAAGATPGTVQTSTGDNLTTGQTAEIDYNGTGTVVSVALCYPGSRMLLSVVDPRGATHATQNAASPELFHLGYGPGLYKAIVKAIDVPSAEPYVVSFASDAPCTPGNIDSGTIVRQTLSNAQLQKSLADSGASGITIQVQGTSPTSARLYYYSNIGGNELSWTIDFYAATPDLGYVLTQITVRGINVTTQVMEKITAAGASVTAIPQGFVVDRVYSCIGPGGNMMVIEGHR